MVCSSYLCSSKELYLLLEFYLLSMNIRNIFIRVISGGPERRSRLHDEKGNFVGWRRLILNGSRAIGSGMLRIVFGVRSEKPWISYSAIKELDQFLDADSRVLEFGSGMSTIWYAKRCKEVYSVDDFRAWYEKVERLIRSKGLSNVKFSFSDDRVEYSRHGSNAGGLFDLVVVDGSYRSDCILTAFELVGPGGIVYLDNSDKDSGVDGGDMRQAELSARRLAVEVEAVISEFTDFAPTQLFVQQGLLIKLPPR